MDYKSATGIVTVASRYSVDQTVDRLTRVLEAKSITIFAIVDHSGEANKVGLRMPNTKLIIFGNPKAGTPLMLTAPSIAIDLPLKILISEDADKSVWVSYTNPDFLSSRYEIPAAIAAPLAVPARLAEEIAH
jgi:uncharacterized protein (DUF302 family)